MGKCRCSYNYIGTGAVKGVETRTDASAGRGSGAQVGVGSSQYSARATEKLWAPGQDQMCEPFLPKICILSSTDFTVLQQLQTLQSFEI